MNPYRQKGEPAKDVPLMPTWLIDFCERYQTEWDAMSWRKKLYVRVKWRAVPAVKIRIDGLRRGLGRGIDASIDT
jgi:hypothetical protein